MSDEPEVTERQPADPPRPAKERPARVQAATKSAEPVVGPQLQSLLADLAAANLGDDVQVTPRPDGWAQVQVPAERLVDVCRKLRDHATLRFNYLSSISALDWQEKGFGTVYHLISLGSSPERHVVVKVDLPRENPQVPSVVEIWPTANWHEREAWDLMGIQFTGHPDLRRILMREDWEGHPLRKDYVDSRPQRERVTRENYRPGGYKVSFGGDHSE